VPHSLAADARRSYNEIVVAARRTVSSRERKNRFGRYLGLAGKSETIIVTGRGKPVSDLRCGEAALKRGFHTFNPG